MTNKSVSQRPYFSIGRPELAELFNVKPCTISKWIELKKINPFDIKDIIDKYNNRSLLDKRKK